MKHVIQLKILRSSAAIALILIAASATPFKPSEVDHGHSFITKGIAGEGYAYKGFNVPAFEPLLL